MPPVAYIRRSARSRSDPGDVSREFQTEKVRELAGADGDRLRIIDQDWGRSAATDKTDKRLAFLGLIDDVEAGRVNALYAYSTDRLARSVEWAARLLNACRRARVPIVTSEGRFEPDNAMTDQLFYFQAMQNEGYSRQASDKRRATVAIQKARGQVIGRKPYGAMPGEDAAAVVQAFKDAGSYIGAVRLLNERGISPRMADHGFGWAPPTIRRVVLREAPDLVPVRPQRGARTLATSRFSRLLVCAHDGSILTTQPRTKESGAPSYICRVARFERNGKHPRPYIVSESFILPWAQREAARIQRLDVTWDEASRQASEERVANLNAKRMRWLEMYAEGDIDKETRDRKLGEVEAEREGLETIRRVRTFTLRQGIDWAAPAATVNARLRELWKAVILGPDMRPVRAEWVVTPEELEAEDIALNAIATGA
ncbi:MAG TPA: recombinase family protein [Nocardioides sp.]|nr:recombinase family protein [Nocardioides sp.]